MIKNILIHMRNSIKLIIIILIAGVLITAAMSFIFRPTYAVTLNGEQIGYSENKSELQSKINTYIEKGEAENVAFVQVDNLPQYKLCLLKKDVNPNDEQIYEKVKQTGTIYYKYYAITQGDEEKIYVSTFQEAENAINSLKEKNSTNKEELRIVEKYETELKPLVTSEEVISKLYVEPVKATRTETKQTTNKTKGNTGVFSASAGTNTSSSKVPINISLIRPISGTISSRYGSRWGEKHSGLDIAAPHGTSIKAASAGTVTYSGWKNGYGYLIIITHGNGIQTYYGHCSSLVAEAGQKVSQGDIVAKVGSTGNSTGNHLHLEVRVNGVAQNPQNYVY